MMALAMASHNVAERQAMKTTIPEITHNRPPFPFVISLIKSEERKKSSQSYCIFVVIVTVDMPCGCCVNSEQASEQTKHKNKYQKYQL